tara:strand:+ start:67 stop:2145 length:2079 start_codon:yes stop_codon:yes gene_type:complete
MARRSEKNFNISLAESLSLKERDNGRSDPEGVFPRVEYEEASSVNNVARGTKRVNVELGGATANLDLDLKKEPVSSYPNSQVKETASGHIVEYDDTPGGERVMIRHKSGSGVEMRADGTMIYGSTNNTVRVTAHDEKVIVDGDGELHYNGNLKLKVSGDFDVEVGGDFNVKVDGDIEQTVKRGYIEDIGGSKEVQILGGKSETIGGDVMNFVHGNSNEIVKRARGLFVGEDQNNNTGGTLFMTAENEITYTSKSINIAASSLAVTGDSGTMGGENIVMYGHTAHIPRVNATSVHASQGVIANVGMTAPTFNGNLSGNANTAGEAARAATIVGSAGGSAQASVTFTEAADSDTQKPTASLMNSALENSSVAIKRVSIDDDAALFNQLNRLEHYGGVSTTDLTTEQIRSKLRDPNNARNEVFISACIADGTLSPHVSRLSPAALGRTVSKDKVAVRGGKPFGRSKNPTKLYKSNKVTDVKTDYYVDPKFNPVNQVAAGIPITSRTRLAPGISMAKFVSAHGDPVTLTHILDDSERLRLAKQYVLHADVLKLINSSSAPTQFKNFRLVPIEGLYRAESGENLDVSDGVNYLMSRGRTVVYELINNKGEMAVEKTFDLAVYFKDNLNYDKMILDYDNFNPDDSLNVQIIITMPEITPPFSVEYKNQFETRYNNITQATNELIEVLRTDEEPEELLT